MKKFSKTRGVGPTKNMSANDRQHEMSLEKSLKQMKQIIAVLTIMVIIGIVWIATLTLSTPSHNKAVRNVPSAENATETNPAQEQSYGLYDMPIESQQSIPPANITSNIEENTAVPSQGKAPKLNPPHGEPFHRCEIAVGAPLNSPPANNPNPMGNPPANNPNTIGNPPANNPIPVSNPPANTNLGSSQENSPKLNPPHGEPGHSCEIAVGAPLN